MRHKRDKQNRVLDDGAVKIHRLRLRPRHQPLFDAGKRRVECPLQPPQLMLQNRQRVHNRPNKKRFDIVRGTPKKQPPQIRHPRRLQQFALVPV